MVGPHRAGTFGAALALTVEPGDLATHLRHRITLRRHFGLRGVQRIGAIVIILQQIEHGGGLVCLGLRLDNLVF